MARLLPSLVLLFVSWTAGAQQTWRPDEVLLLLRKDARADQVRLALHGLLPSSIALKEMTALGRNSRYYLVTVNGTAVDEVALEKLLARTPGVEATSLNYLLQYRAQPNDDLYPDQWSMAAIGAEQVWDHTTGGNMANGARIAVAINDGLVETTHPDLTDNISPASTHSGAGDYHGTQVAGVVGATGNNGIGVTGVNWDVDLVPVGHELGGSTAGAISGFAGALSLREDFNNSGGMEGALVVAVTVSWGLLHVGCEFGYPIFEDMGNAGILAITAAPNEPVDIDVVPDFPSTCTTPNNIAVTGIGPDGENPFAVGNSTIHLQAPGIAIPTTAIGNAYQVVEGTSFAVPHVAGAVALLYSMPCPSFAQLVMTDPPAAAQLVKSAILQGGVLVPDGDAITITGRTLNVHGAYQILMGQCVQTCTELTVTFTPAEGTVAEAVLTGPQGNTVATANGAVLQGCLEIGCYEATFSATGGTPVNGTWIVTDSEANVIASGSSADGQLPFSFGDLVSGCTIPGSGNFNPLANCNDGSCCAITPEVCDGVDNDCDGEVDEDFVWYTDADGDGFGAPGTGAVACIQPPNTVSNDADCNDSDPAITVVGTTCDDGDPNTLNDHVRADCQCLGFEQGDCPPGEILDCNGNCAPLLFIDDFSCDNGSFEWEGNLIDFNCAAFYFDGGDCAGCPPEECNGADDDCDGIVDEGFIWYVDADGDGYGANGSGTSQCTPPGAGFVQIEGDCDDADETINPGATEACDGIDNDCDGTVDDDFIWFVDADGDGHGSTVPLGVHCTQPPNSAADSTDCNDADPDTYVGVDLFVTTENDDAGSAHFVLVQGATILEGDISIPAGSFGAASACITDDCFTISVSPNDVPLFGSSFVEFHDDPGNFIPFSTVDGYDHPGSTEVCNGIDDDCDGDVDEDCGVSIAVRVQLGGPYDPDTGLMADGMRALGLVPTTEPYTGLGYVHAGGGGGETTTPPVLAASGPDATVDWVVLELRDALDPTVITASRCALLQRDGDVVEVDGLSPVTLATTHGNYHVAVRHRNHLPAMTLNSFALGTAPVSIDFAQAATSTFGTEARRSITGTFPTLALWQGDVTFEGEVKYTGDGNDRDPILQSIGGTVPTAIIGGYHPQDVNLNGNVQYTGDGNDRDQILITVGGTIPTNTREAQLP